MKALPIFLTMVLSGALFAQQISVSSDSRTVKGATADGFTVSIEGSAESVSQSLVRFLKGYGKPKAAGNVITVTSPVLGGNPYEKQFMYAVAAGDATSSTAWIGLNKEEWPNNDTEVLLARIKDLTYQFGVKYYRDRMQMQIDETQQAVEAIERKVQRLIQQNKDLNIKLLDNEQNKVKLEKALVQNGLDHASLLLKIEANKKSQDSVAAAGVQVKKVLDAQRDKQSKIN
ncbi:MAG: hypothetical protein ACKOAR_02555 [Bacteroidota bacterium]